MWQFIKMENLWFLVHNSMALFLGLCLVKVNTHKIPLILVVLAYSFIENSIAHYVIILLTSVLFFFNGFKSIEYQPHLMYLGPCLLLLLFTNQVEIFFLKTH